MTPNPKIRLVIQVAMVLIFTTAPVYCLAASDSTRDQAVPPASAARIPPINTKISAVLVLGQVQAAGPYDAPRGSRLLDVIRMAGGFTSAAKSNAVQVVRKLKDGTSVTTVVDCNAPIKDNSKEKPNGLFTVEPGDKIFVPEAPR